MTHPDRIADRLRAHGLRVTPGRYELLELILSYDTAIPHSEIQERLADRDRVTLYRNLQALTEAGIIHKAGTPGDDELHYAACASSCEHEAHSHQHLHFSCTRCAKVRCLDVEAPQIARIDGHEIRQIEWTASGICKDCRDDI